MFHLSLIYILNSYPFNKDMNLNSECGNSLNSLDGGFASISRCFPILNQLSYNKKISYGRQFPNSSVVYIKNVSCLCHRSQGQNYYTFGISLGIKLSLLFILRSQTTHTSFCLWENTQWVLLCPNIWARKINYVIRVDFEPSDSHCFLRMEGAIKTEGKGPAVDSNVSKQ